MRLTFVIGSLDAGGAQRVLVLLTEGLIRRGHVVAVVTLNGKENDFFSLSEGISRIALNISTRWKVFFGLPKLRSAILSTKPDVVISFIETMNTLTLLALGKQKIPIVVSDRIDPRTSPLASWQKRLKNWSYRRARRIIVQTEDAAAYYLGPLQKTTQVIPNPIVTLPHREIPMHTTLKKPFILSMGRLRHQKGFDLLIRAFAKIADKYPEWTLVLIGEGVERRHLEALGSQLGLGNRLQLPGRMPHSHTLFKQAELFVLSSRYEGFPNVLCEAMSCGMAVIATDCPSGPRDIIRNGQDGLIVPNEDSEALSEAMDHLMSDEAERRRLAAESATIVDRYGLSNVVQKWEATFVKVLSESRLPANSNVESATLKTQ